MKFSSVLFDLDGTLLKTADDLGAALNHVMRHYNRPEVSRAAYTSEATNGSKALLQLGFGSDFKDHDFETLKGLFLNYYAENIARHTDYFDEVVKTLTFLNDNNIPWGIVTNKPGFLTDPLLKQFPLLDNCGSIVSGDTVGVAKPDPKPMFHALSELNRPASSCLYIGDAQRDIEAGHRAGMKTAAALYGYIKHDEDTDAWGADYYFDNISELIELISA